MSDNILLSFDYGQRRVGIALGVSLTGTARPLQTIAWQAKGQARWEPVDHFVAEWRPDRLLVGWPTHDQDTPHPLEKAISRFSNQLKERYRLPVSFVDETFSSYEAASRLKSQRQSGRKRPIDKHELDQQSAAILLENWFNAQASTPHGC